MSPKKARSEQFHDQLAELVSAYADVAPGARGMALFTAFAALATSEKGAFVSTEDVARLCATMTKRLVRIGLVIRDIPTPEEGPR
jgi:hypothetical protein